MLNYDYGRKYQEFMKKFRNMMCMEVALRDETSGTLTLDKKGKILVDKPMSDLDKANLDKGVGIIHEMLTAVSAKEIMTSPLQTGLHLMGGTAMGHYLEQTVVGEDYKVYGCDNLYVVDGGLYANASGINPSRTIMALAHRASQTIWRRVGLENNLFY